MKKVTELPAEGEKKPDETVLEPLHAHDKVEGMSDAGRAAFQRLCGDMPISQQQALDVRRILKEDSTEHRRVTRHKIFKVFEALNIDPQAQKRFWLEYFGGPATSIAEFVRRQIILHGDLRDYAKTVGLSHATLLQLLSTRMISFASLETLRAHQVPFPWEKAVLHRQWRAMSCSYLQQREGLNVLGARVETLFEMRRPKVSRTQWVELGNLPESLKDCKKSHVIDILSRARHGRSESWEELDRVLVGMNCSLEERMEVAEAWLMTHNQPFEEQPSRVRKKKNNPLPLHDDEQTSGVEEHPIPQNQTPYPEHLVGKESLAAIADIAAEFTGETDFRTLAEDEAALAARVHQTLLNVDVFVAAGKKEVRKPTDVTVVAPRRNPRTLGGNIASNSVDTSPQGVERETISGSDEQPSDAHRALAEERKRIAGLIGGILHSREASAQSPAHQKVAALIQGLIARKENDEEYYLYLRRRYAPQMERIARSIDSMIDSERGSMVLSKARRVQQQTSALPPIKSIFELEDDGDDDFNPIVASALIHGDETGRQHTKERAQRRIPHHLDPAEDE